MPLISNSNDVYRRLIEEAHESWLYGLVAYAVVEEQRIEWMEHYENNNGHPPDSGEIQHWYEQQPENVLLSPKGKAENALQGYADEVLEEVEHSIRSEVSEGVIISEIRLATKFWPQFGINVAAGFASALPFAAVLTILAFIVLTDPSPVKFGARFIGNSAGESHHGQTNGESRSDKQTRGNSGVKSAP